MVEESGRKTEPFGEGKTEMYKSAVDLSDKAKLEQSFKQIFAGLDDVGVSALYLGFTKSISGRESSVTALDFANALKFGVQSMGAVTPLERQASIIKRIPQMIDALSVTSNNVTLFVNDVKAFLLS